MSARSKEMRRLPVRLPASTTPGKTGVVLRPGVRLSTVVEIPRTNHPVRHRWRLLGEVEVFRTRRCEAGMPEGSYRSVEDALDADRDGMLPAVRPPVRIGNNAVCFFDPLRAANMKEAAEYFVSNPAESRGRCTRHIGPSTLFRYFFQAGYDRLGAELMCGPVDLLPAEAPFSVLEGYGAAVFLGWNTFVEDDFRGLLRWVANGGTLLLAKPRLSTQVRRLQLAAAPSSPTLRRLLGDENAQATSRILRRVGKGRVICFPADRYPAEAAIRPEYEREMTGIAERAAASEALRGLLRGARDVDFVAFDWADGRLRTIYVLNIDWRIGSNTRRATRRLGQREFPIRARSGMNEAVTVSANCAVQPLNSDVDVMDVRDTPGGTGILLQSDGPTELRVFPRAGDERQRTIRVKGWACERSCCPAIAGFI